MASNMSQMNYQEVRNAAKKFQDLAQQLKQVYQALQQIGQTFQKAAALGAVGAAAMKVVTDVMRVVIQLRIQQFMMLRSGMIESAFNHQMGDQEAAPIFDEGIDLG